MSSSSRLLYLMNSAYVNDSLPAARLAFDEWQAKNCSDLKRVRIFDAHLQQSRVINVPCGSCYHCRQTKINEWCTRMYAHAEDFKNVYFVTLTYRSIPVDENPISKLILYKLGDALWFKDAFNSTKHICYRPCVLVKRHYQNFIKRLRKNTGLNDITYVLSGEYGKKYGAPHFHMILFTNGLITEKDIRQSWSVSLFRYNNGDWSFKTNQSSKNGVTYNIPVGRIDYHNLVSNGTFNTTARIKVDNQLFSPSRCFSYVCKYVCKSEKENLQRVRLAYNNLFTKKLFTKIYSKEVPFELLKSYLLDLKYSCNDIDSIINDIISKKLTYEKIIFTPSKSFFGDISEFEKVMLFGHEVVVDAFPRLFIDFCNSFRSFVEFSRGTPIGSIYAKRNLQEFKQGIYSKPVLQTNGFIVPSYFRRKAQNDLYGIRVCNRTLKGSSFALGGLPVLLGHLKDVRQGKTLFRYGFNSSCPLDSCLQSTLSNSSKILIDLSTGSRLLAFDGYMHHYKYVRSKRKYIEHYREDFDSWLVKTISAIEEELSRYYVTLRISKQNIKDLDSALCIMCDIGESFVDAAQRYELSLKQFLDEQQRLYNDLHISCE